MHPSSMTAYGFGELSEGVQTYSCEIRSLNSRYLEVSVRLPRHLMPLEAELVNHVKGKLRRGKVDIFIDCTKSAGAKDLPHLDAEVLAHYAKLLGQASVALLQPSPHALQRGRREIEVPGRCEISDTALVSQVVKKGAIRGLRACDLRQPGLDGREPGRIGETGLAMENGQVIRILPMPGLGLVEQPSH